MKLLSTRLRHLTENPDEVCGAEARATMLEAAEALERHLLSALSHAPRKPEPWAYAVMQPKGAEFDYLVFPDYGEAESHVADAEDEREIIPLFPPSVPSTTGRIPDLEPSRINADYWLNEARGKQEEGRGDVLICAEQAINAWKNAAYAMADQRDSARSAIAPNEEMVKLARSKLGRSTRCPVFEMHYLAAEVLRLSGAEQNNRADGGKQT